MTESSSDNKAVEAWRLYRHLRPTRVACRIMERHSIGAIISTEVHEGYREPLVDVIDTTSAYLFAATFGLPTGPHAYFGYGNTEGFVWWEAHNVTRTKDGEEPVYHDVITSPEVKYFQERGWNVPIDKGIGFYELTFDANKFVNEITQLRHLSKTDFVKKNVKGVGVAWVGKRGRKNNLHVLVPIDGTDTTLDPVTYIQDGKIRIAPYAAKLVYSKRHSSMPHWYHATIGQSRVNIMLLQDIFRENDTLLATDTDCVYVRPSHLTEKYDRKGSRNFEPGELTLTRLFDVTFEKNRWMSWFDAEGHFHTKRPGDPLITRPTSRDNTA